MYRIRRRERRSGGVRRIARAAIVADFAPAPASMLAVPGRVPSGEEILASVRRRTPSATESWATTAAAASAALSSAIRKSELAIEGARAGETRGGSREQSGEPRGARGGTRRGDQNRPTETRASVESARRGDSETVSHGKHRRRPQKPAQVKRVGIRIRIDGETSSWVRGGRGRFPRGVHRPGDA